MRAAALGAVERLRRGRKYREEATKQLSWSKKVGQFKSHRCCSSSSFILSSSQILKIIKYVVPYGTNDGNW